MTGVSSMQYKMRTC